MLRDSKGELIAAGGFGQGASLAGCMAPDVVVTRKELGCAPFPGDEKIYFSQYAHANFALRFTADASLTLAQRGRGSLTIKGKKYRVANFMSYDHIELWASDTWGPMESYALVQE